MLARIVPLKSLVETRITYESTVPIGTGSESATYAQALFAPFLDAWLASRGRFAILQSSGAAAAAVSVVAYHGNIILEGEVLDSAVRDGAERAVSALPGVIGVANHVRVRGELRLRPCGDAEIRAALSTRLRHARSLRGSIIRIASVYDGVVTLAGTARSAYACAVAFELTIHVPGVRRVVNDVALASTTGAAPAADAA